MGRRSELLGFCAWYPKTGLYRKGIIQRGGREKLDPELLATLLSALKWCPVLRNLGLWPMNFSLPDPDLRRPIPKA